MQPQLHEELLGYVTFGCEQKRFARRCAWTRSVVLNSGFVNHRIRVMPFLGISCMVIVAIKRKEGYLSIWKLKDFACRRALPKAPPGTCTPTPISSYNIWVGFRAMFSLFQILPLTSVTINVKRHMPPTRFGTFINLKISLTNRINFI